MIEIENIRNFSIIAHINHGKSTLADRFIEICKKLKLKKSEELYLDSMELEKERGITIKAQCLTLNYFYRKKNYILNLIDTPGHIDFSYEVTRALSVCEGVILLIDVSKGIQAQTISNYNKAKERNLTVLVAINKIDLCLDKDSLLADIKSVFGINDVLELSGKKGLGVENLIECIINKIPSPKKSLDSKFCCLIIDAFFDNYSGITCLVKIISGTVKKNDKTILSCNNDIIKINEVGIFIPEKKIKDILSVGEIGFVIFPYKKIEDIKINSYIYANGFSLVNKNDVSILPKIFANIFTIDSNDFELLKKAIIKLSLNDSSIVFTIQKSQVFGFGFRCGFLGILHLEITKERLEREYNLSIIVTPPNVTFKVLTFDLKELFFSNPCDINLSSNVKLIYEQIALVTIISPKVYFGKIKEFCINYRGIEDYVSFLDEKVYIRYKIPLCELIYDFFNLLQTITNGYASLDYDVIGFVESDLNKVSVLINDKKVDALEFMIHKSKIYNFSVKLLDKIKKVIPRQLFDIKIQAAVGKKILSKVVIKALKKNVLSKCYGGDISRKKKLLEKQKAGKKKLKKIGNVYIPHDAFIKIMKFDS